MAKRGQRPVTTPGPEIGRPSAAGRGVTLALLASLALWLGASLPESNWLWGVDALHFWPAWGAAALALLALAGFVPPIGRRIGQGLESLGRKWDRAGVAGDLAASFGVMLVLFALRDRVRFAGDFDLRVGQLGLEVIPPALLAHVYPLDQIINYDLARVFWKAGLDPATALQVTGTLMGGLFALIGFRFLRAAGARGAALVAGALALLGGGTLIHFAGYDKFGPLLVGLALAALGAVQMARTGRGAWTLAAGVSAAVLSHRSGYLAVPAAAWVLARGLGTGDARQRREIRVAAAGMIVAIFAMSSRTYHLLLEFDRPMHLPGGAVTQARAAGEAPVALLKITDFLNALSLLAPLWLAAGAALVTRARAPGSKAARFSLAVPAALALGAFFLLLFGVEPGGGWSRDWDVATGPGALAALATAYILVNAWSDAGARSTLAPAATLALAASVALWGVHASEAMSLERVKMIVTAHPLPSASMRTGVYDFWGVRDLNGGRPAEAAEHFEQAIAIGGPNPRLVYQAGLAYLGAGQWEKARSSFARTASLNRGIADPWRGLARVALIERDTLAALAALDSVLARRPADLESGREADVLRKALGRAP